MLDAHTHGDVRLLAGMVMPDHIHVLFELGERLSVGRVIGKLKTLARDHGRADWRWLDDGFERHLRANEDSEDYGFYTFMNPYRARLITIDEIWPGWVCPETRTFRFGEKLRADSLPQPEWLTVVDEVSKRIVTGE